MNADRAQDYVAAIDRRGGASARSFRYEPDDLRLLHVTRSLSALAIDRAAYEAFFGTTVYDDFADVVGAVQLARLVDVRGAIRLTPRGMFYADSVAGLFAWRRTSMLRDANESTFHAMG